MKTVSQIESKQRSLTLSLLFLVAFSASAFEFSSGVLRAEATPVPSATPAAQINTFTIGAFFRARGGSVERA